MRHSTVRHSSSAVWQNQITGNDVIIKKESTTTGTKHIYVSTWLKYQKTLSNRGYTPRTTTTILIGSWNGLYALNPEDGSIKWKFLTDPLRRVKWCPTVGGDGTIYFNATGDVYALTPDGALKWRYNNVNYTMGEDNPSMVIDSDGTLYFGCCGDYFYALNSDGTLKWRYTAIGKLFGSPAIAIDGTIYVRETMDTNHDYLCALNPDGSLKWKYLAGEIYYPPCVGDDGTIYFGSWDGYVYALNPEGTLKWRYFIDDVIVVSPSLHNDTLYVGAWDDYLYAFNLDGSLKWRYLLSDDVDYTTPTIGQDGTIYVGTIDYILYAINPDGTLKWQYTMDDEPNSPIVDSNGTLYVGADYFYAFNPDGTLKWVNELVPPTRAGPAII